MNRPLEPSERARWERVCAVLDAVLEAPARARQRVLAEECGGDSDLRHEVEVLLATQSGTDARLDSPVLDWAGELLDDDDEPLSDLTAGDAIGPYRVVRELGRGGMGTVWLAERGDGEFEQHVAVKLLKRGLDSDAILARFLEERRILARLQHPNIAHLLDGGVTEHGRPYFAMEWVEGEPITDWCDSRRLGVRERITVFCSVLEAVQHAHQRLIVHRDLKPTNVLITPSGDVKLLDFGIAKVLDSEEGRAESATLTRLGWRMLTPDYAAPEQLRGDAVTTATDIYALGILLHELLTGQRPKFSVGRDGDAADEAPRVTPRPSRQVSDEAAPQRGTSRERLRRTLRGDLDTVVRKALHSDPARRYRSADAFREDLQRYLDAQPVQARPDSAWYRGRKFVARHRLGVAAAILLALSLAGGLLTTAWQARRAQSQTREAQHQAQRAEAVKEFLVGLMQLSNPQSWRGEEVTAQTLLDTGASRVDEETAGDPELHAELLVVFGELYLSRGQLERAEELIRRSLEERRELFGADHQAYADSLYMWAFLRYQQGDWEGSERAITRSVEIFRRKLGDHPHTATALGGLAVVRLASGDRDEAIRLRREALAMHRKTVGSMHKAVAHDLQELGTMLVAQGRYAEAEPILEEAMEIRRELHGERSAGYATALNGYARLLAARGDHRQAAVIYGETVDIYREAGDEWYMLPTGLSNQGLSLCDLGQYEQAEPLLREALAIRRQYRPAGHHDIGLSLSNLGRCLMDAGRPVEAEPLLRQAVGILEDDAGPRHERTLGTVQSLGEVLYMQDRLEDAETVLRRAHDGFHARFGADHPKTAMSLQALAHVQMRRGERRSALAAGRKAFATTRRVHGLDHPRTASAAVALATLELEAQRWQEAEQLLRQILPVLEGYAGDSGPKTLKARMLYGVALTHLDRLDEAARTLRAVVEERRAVSGAAAPPTAEAEIHLGACLARRGDRAEARALLVHGRRTLAAREGEEHHLIRFAGEQLAELP